METSIKNKMEAKEIMEIVKPKMLNGCKSGKTMDQLTLSVAEVLESIKCRERSKVGTQIKQQYSSHILHPSASLKNRFRFLFLGKL